MSIHQAYFIHYTLLLIVFTYLKLKKKKKSIGIAKGMLSKRNRLSSLEKPTGRHACLTQGMWTRGDSSS